MATSALFAQQPQGMVVVQARSESGFVSQVEVQAGGQIVLTNEQGEATLELPAGDVEINLQRYGYASKTVRATIVAGQTTRLEVELEAESVLEEEVFVTATRADVRIEDEPLRVEVVDQEEVDEKAMMTPGDIAMLLNETSGLRVQVTSPSLGAANVRVQGLRGRYTQLLADGLPLYGQTGSIGILQIPPLDLGQVEVIKGVASALYGSSALGGVINLASRRPNESQRELLLNATTRKGSDTVFWLAEPKRNLVGYTILGGIHFQGRSDLDDDDWADLPEYQRGVLRPRLFWDNGAGNSFFATVGATVEGRAGGGLGFPEELRTRRVDGGVVGRFLVGRQVASVRGSVMTQRHRHRFGEVVENDRHHTVFGEAALSGSNSGHTWAAGVALHSDRYRSREVSRFNFTHTIPAVFAQDEYAFGSRLTLSASGRLDVHNEYGTFFNPRVSALLRLPRQWTVRLSTGTGVFAPTPFTEETEVTGLSRLQPLTGVKAERAWSSSADLGWKTSAFELNGTIFGSIIRNAVSLSESVAITNAKEPTRTIGSELLARFRRGRFNVIATHVSVRSTEMDVDTGVRRHVSLTPTHSAGIDTIWEDPERGRIGIEVYYTGRQHLEDNPYRTESEPYWLYGVLLERRWGRIRVFLNAENLGNVRQTRHDPLIRPVPSFDGRRTVDAWAPLEGRVINGGLRFSF